MFCIYREKGMKFNMEVSLEEAKQKYKLSEEKHREIQESIMQIMLYDKYPVEKPKAIIDIAPPASGKTGLNSYAHEEFENDNVVIINSDELKPFHPKVDEIAKLYPEYYTKITDQESNTWTSHLFETALQQHYNVIFEGTGRNAKILETIQNRMQDYEVTVRGMAVNELNCLISILERYEYQVHTKGWGRLVTLHHFYETYNQMPSTIDAIEKSGMVEKVEIYKRGELPHQPLKIYDSMDKESGRFPNAKYAILGGRLEDEKMANQYYETKLVSVLELLKEKDISEEEKEILRKMQEIHENRKKLPDKEK